MKKTLKTLRYTRGRGIVTMVVLLAFAAFTPILAQDSQKENRNG